METVFRPRSDRPVSQHSTEHREIEHSAGVFKWMKATEESTIYAPPRGGVEKFEFQMFNPNAAGWPRLREWVAQER